MIRVYACYGAVMVKPRYHKRGGAIFQMLHQGRMMRVLDLIFF